MRPHLISHPPISRPFAAITAFLLAAVCVVHLIDGPGSLSDVPYIGVLELALAAICAPLVVAMLMFPARSVWVAVVALTTVSLAAYVASRTVGLPGSSDDIGNWGQILGLVNMGCEVLLLAVGSYALGGPALKPRPVLSPQT